jgi:hypothetical protein
VAGFNIPAAITRADNDNGSISEHLESIGIFGGWNILRAIQDGRVRI